MKRVNVLRIKLLITGLHAFVLLGPIALLSIALDKLADFCRWASDRSDSICVAGGKVLLPQWWPSHRILELLNHEHVKERQKKADKLHE